MFEVVGLDVAYGDVQVLWDVSLRLDKGELVTVIGPNGAGKSTLLKSIVGLVKPQRTENGRGRIVLEGQSLVGLPAEEVIRHGIAIVPEGARVFPDMTVLDNLRLGSYLPEARVRREETLRQVFGLFPRLEDRKSQIAKTLSGGERQMLAIGRSLMSRPRLLLLDEPSLGLQPSIVAQTFDTIKTVNERGTTVLLVEQKVHFSLEICHRAYVLENGRVVLQGPGQELLENEHIKKAYLAM
ncbi:MAG: ABC transporter ATP-binding protein [Nitrospinota bacterium]